MAISREAVNHLILEQLAHGEKRLLVLTVAIRKSLASADGIKGDLPAMVKSSLRKMVASKTVMDVEGVYTLVRAK